MILCSLAQLSLIQMGMCCLKIYFPTRIEKLIFEIKVNEILTKQVRFCFHFSMVLETTDSR